MTPLTPEQEEALRHLSLRTFELMLGEYINRELTARIPRHGFDGPGFYAGRFSDGLTWLATYDHDGLIEISFSYQNRRPSNWEIKQAFTRFHLTPYREESKATGKLRHYIIQKGRPT